MRASVEEGRGLSADEPHGRRGGVLGPRPRRPGLVLVRVGVGIARRVRVARAVALPVVHGLVLVRLVRLLDDARRLVVRDGRRHDQRGGRDAHLAAAAQLRVDEARVVRGPVPDAVLLVRGQVGERLAPHERDGVVERHGFAHFRRARVRARPLFVVVRRRDRLEELGHVGARVRLVEVRVERRVALVVLGLGRGAVAQEEVDELGARERRRVVEGRPALVVDRVHGVAALLDEELGHLDRVGLGGLVEGQRLCGRGLLEGGRRLLAEVVDVVALDGEHDLLSHDVVVHHVRAVHREHAVAADARAAHDATSGGFMLARNLGLC
mmetsp:Transcript_11925/g.35826  ORF Transcript_11925/g.35826 Transcript_11925/m.35826 type:complete len:324 (-) Transcript_11925:63-1034(-)